MAEVRERITAFESPAACWADAHERMTKGRSMPWCVVSIRADLGHSGIHSGIHPDAIASCDECKATYDEALKVARAAYASYCMTQFPPDRWLCWACAVRLAPPIKIVVAEESGSA